MAQRTTAVLRKRRAKTGVLLGIATFCLTQLLAAFAQNHWPQLCDPAFRRQFTHLRARLAESPGRPLVLVLGSSRPWTGFRPDRFRGGQAVGFNWSYPGCGPVGQLIGLRRLLGQGLRPAAVVLEVWPPLLTGEMGGNEAFRIRHTQLARCAWGDVAVLLRYTDRPRALLREWLGMQLVPSYFSRQALHETDNGSDRLGWISVRPIPEGDPRYETAAAGNRYYQDLLKRFEVCDICDRALRECLALCRERGISATLVYWPEAKQFQGWYPREVVARYVDRLSRETSTPWIDARNWVPSEHLPDLVHLDSDGATICSERLGEEIFEAHAKAGALPPTVRE